jgi:hypothetical protein
MNDHSTALRTATAVASFPRRPFTWRAVAIRARLRRAALEGALAQGRDPWASPELMLCAARLTSTTTRRKLADAIDAAIFLAEDARPVPPSVGLRRTALLAERDSLSEMADRLRAPAPVSVIGVARVAQLLWRSESPLFGEEGAEGDDVAIRATIDACWETLIPAYPMPS